MKPLRWPHSLAPTVVALVALGVLLAGCSSNGKPAAGATGSPQSSSVKTPTGSVIKIGVIGSNSGPQASSASQGATVGPAWAEYVNNDLGGIHGHRVEVVSVDDKGDPVSTQAAAKQLISDGVVAVVAAADNLINTSADSMIAAKIPVVSGTANFPQWYTQVGLFPTVTDVLSGLQAQVLVAKRFGHAKVFANLYCAEISACGQAGPTLQAAASKAGIGYVSFAVSSTATSYTAQCVALAQHKVDYAQLNFTSAAAAKFVQDCQAQNYNPTWGTSEQAIGADFLELPDFTAYGPAYAFPSVADAPVVQTFRNAMTKYAKNDNWHEGTASFAWSGLEAIRKALSGITATTTVTGATITVGLNTFQNENLDGLLANKITFTAGKPTPFGSHPCAFVVGVKGGKTITPDGLTPLCPGAN
jgi:branched-chain amino acid transport system substrate-binding protein